MDHRELRPGNFVRTVTGEHPITGVSIESAGYWFPIALTEDFLLRAGYKYRNEHRGKGAIMDFGTSHSIGITEDKYVYLTMWKAPLKWLHQLQNIHYCVTGEELTYIPDPNNKVPMKEQLQK